MPKDLLTRTHDICLSRSDSTVWYIKFDMEDDRKNLQEYIRVPIWEDRIVPVVTTKVVYAPFAFLAHHKLSYKRTVDEN